MSNIIEIKAKDRELAIKRALKILEVSANQIVQVTELKKPSSFFGFFVKDGLYKIEVNRNLKTESKDEDTDTKEILSKKEKITKVIKKERRVVKESEVITLAKDLLNKMGLDLKVELISYDGRHCSLNLSGEDVGIIIGKKGKTLNSYEYLLNSFVKDIKIDVDVEGFKEKRNETLRELGKKMAEKAIATSKITRLNPMPPRERKIIHEVLNTYPELETYSEGRDPKRYIVIKKKR